MLAGVDDADDKDTSFTRVHGVHEEDTSLQECLYPTPLS